ncbi:TPA: histidinol dehydrogenase [Candidatus Micrarchaeota archaeon]|nr:histidinol dehydrogenase [Candidatus Micrarchaeota archaeon]
MIETITWAKATEAQRKRVLIRSGLDVSRAMDPAMKVFDSVRERGDDELLALSEKYDGVKLDRKNLRVSDRDFEDAYRDAGLERVSAIRRQIALSRKFALAQLKAAPLEWQAEIADGVIGGLKWTPLESVGLYIPGGNAPYPTVMQILGVPAKVAGVKRVVACVPPKNCTAEVLVAARESGVDEVYRVGGPGAIAAMALGTASIRPVLKIVGPGSPMVVAAKFIANNSGVAIDMPAGPSEVLIVAEEKGGGKELPSLIAADMISANEHGKDSASVLVTDSRRLAAKVRAELELQVAASDRQKDVKESLRRYSAIVLVPSLKKAVDFANEYASEHLQLLVRNPRRVLRGIRNAGSVFIGKGGPWNFKALGDYAIGVNHILPTARAARAYSPVGVHTFLKAVQFSEVSQRGFEILSPILETISTAELFNGHRNCGRLRMKIAKGSSR